MRILIPLLLCACTAGAGGLSDAGTDAGLSEADCEQQVTAGWASTLPSVGIATSTQAASYDAVIGSIMHDYGVPGGAVALVKDGRLVFAKGYGFADPAALEIAHPDHLFRIASLSKQVTSAAILLLVDRGQLSLDASAFGLLAAQPLSGQTVNPQLASITVRELLRHTGGWNRDVQGDPMFRSQTISAAAGQPGPAECATIISYMLSQPLQYTPGSTYDYSNFGYCVLGAVIEKVTGTPYEQWVTANVLTPAGVHEMRLGHTRLAQRADGEVAYVDYPGAGLAASVFPGGGQVAWPYGGFYLEAMAAHGAWIASPVDLLRFQTALDGRRGTALLSSSSLAAMVANPSVPWGTTSGGNSGVPSGYWYGMGWSVNSAGNWWHTGSLPGTATEQVHAAGGYGWAAFFNTRPQDADGFFSRLDGDLWTALGNAGTPPATDSFDQYAPAFTAWSDAATYQATFDAQKNAGNYPVHVEGALQSGASVYRARFAPFHGSAFASGNGMDCNGYVAKAAQQAAQGYATVSLQTFVAADGARRYQATWAK